MTKPLYEQDVVLWSAEQAQALRAAQTARINTPSPIDWENVAEEIESLGTSQRSELKSRIAIILEHLLKLQTSPSVEPRNSWMDTIDVQRRDVGFLLESSPSLRREAASLIEKELPRARHDVRRKLARYRERPLTDPELITYTEDQVLGEWLPDDPSPASSA